MKEYALANGLPMVQECRHFVVFSSLAADTWAQQKWLQFVAHDGRLPCWACTIHGVQFETQKADGTVSVAGMCQAVSRRLNMVNFISLFGAWLSTINSTIVNRTDHHATLCSVGPAEGSHVLTRLWLYCCYCCSNYGAETLCTSQYSTHVLCIC